MLAHQQERLSPVTFLQPIEGEVGDDVSDVTLVLHTLTVSDHGWVVVDPRPGRMCQWSNPTWITNQVPLAYYGCLIATAVRNSFGKVTCEPSKRLFVLL